MESVYDQIGGFASVRKIIIEFYNRVLDNDNLAPYFEHTAMERLIDHQTKFVAMLLGGPASYSDNELRKLHERLKIVDDHFDLIKKLLIETFEDFDLASDQIDHVAREFEARRNLIVVS